MKMITLIVLLARSGLSAADESPDNTIAGR